MSGPLEMLNNICLMNAWSQLPGVNLRMFCDPLGCQLPSLMSGPGSATQGAQLQWLDPPLPKGGHLRLGAGMTLLNQQGAESVHWTLAAGSGSLWPDASPFLCNWRHARSRGLGQGLLSPEHWSCLGVKALPTADRACDWSWEDTAPWSFSCHFVPKPLNSTLGTPR